MSDRAVFLAIGAMCLAGAIMAGLWLEYLHWFVYPEYTHRLFFWKFWNVSIATGVCGFVGIWCLERGFRRRSR
jgi:hypothetical protein